MTCLNHASFHLLTVAGRDSCGPTGKLILLRTQSLVLCSKEEMRRSFLRHLVSKAWIFLLFFQSVSRIRVSQPWRRTEVTRDLYHLNLLAKLMVLHHHILFSLVLLPLLRQSCCRFLLSRCHPCTGLLPGTCTWSPPLNFGPFMLISMLMLFVLLVISLLSMLTCIPYAMGLSMSLLVRS